MPNDAIVLFTECHGHYIRGVRVAVRERTEIEHGEDWWDKGVLANVTPDQRQQLERLAYIQSPDSLEDLLDAPHFGPIVCGSKLFLDYIGDSLAMFRKFRQLNRIRNEWAHVRMDRTPAARVVQAITIMEDVLSLLRRREALEVKKIRDDYSTHPLALASDMEKLPEEDDLDALEDFDALAPFADELDPMSVWSHLHSYLALDTAVLTVEDSRYPDRIRVTVTNRSSTENSAPVVHFRDVSVVVHTSGRSGYRLVEGSQERGELAPGESFTFEVNMPLKQMAFTEFELVSRVDWDRLFSHSRRETLPSEFVRPILDELLERFESLGIMGFLDSVLNSIDRVGPDMTIQEASDLRSELQGFREIVAQKVEAIGKTMQEFMLDWRIKPGTHFNELAVFLRGLSEKIQALDEAFSQTDFELINQAINELEQSKLAVMRLENAIKGTRGQSN